MVAATGADGALDGDFRGRSQAASGGPLFLFIGADPNTSWLEGAGVDSTTGLYQDPKRRATTFEMSRDGVYSLPSLFSGNVKRKTDPPPGFSSTQMRPP